MRAITPTETVISVMTDTAIEIAIGMMMLRKAYCRILIGATARDNDRARHQIQYRCSSELEDNNRQECLHALHRQSVYQLAR